MTERTTRITRVGTVIIPVSDQDRALEFYVGLGAAARRALARRGRLRARLVSVERGVRGPKTTIRPLVVRKRPTVRRAPRAPAGQAATSSTVSFIVGQGLRITGTPGVGP